MSFLKFWKGRPKGGSRGGLNEDNTPTAMAEQADLEDADKKAGRLKHSLSISRSGRYKAKKKERTGFLDKPDMFATPPDEDPGNSPGEHPSGRSPSSSQRVSQSPVHRRTPSNPSSCREGTQISSLRLKHPPTITSQQPTAV